MKIAVNAQLLLFDRLEGIGRFAYETLWRMCSNHPEHDFLFISDRPTDARWNFPNNVHWISTRLPSRHPLLWYLRFHWEIPRMLKKYGADVFLSPDGWSVPSALPKLVVLHDLNFLEAPENIPLLTRLYFKHFFPIYARQAQVLVTVSQFSAQDIQQRLGIPASKVSVVYNAAGTDFNPLEESKINQIRAQFNQGKPYLVFVGAQLPRKNIPRLLQALDAIWSENPQAPNLLLVGEPMWSGTELNSVVKTMKNSTKLNFTGRLQRPQVAEVIGAADGLLLPSLFEGFGIPVLEAMACGVPVLTSNSTSLPEVAADAAVLVNPTDVQHIKQGIEQLLYNQELRQQSIEKGLNRSAQFSWEQSAEALFKNLERIFPDKTSTHSHD